MTESRSADRKRSIRQAAGLELRVLELILTSACNLRCGYCYQNAKGRRRMTWETLRAALDLLLESSAPRRSVVFLGGEPLLELDLVRRAVEHLRAARRSGCRIELSLSTNGLRLDREAARFLARHRVKTQLSFDGVRPAQAARAPGTFEALDRLLDRLRREQPAFFRRRLRVALTLTPANLPFLAESVRYFLAKGVGDLAISPVITPDAGWRSEDRKTMSTQLVRVYRASLAHYRRTGEVSVRLFRRQGSEDAAPAGERGLCGAATGTALAVDVDGQVYSCAVFAGSFQRFVTPLLRDCAAALRLGDVRAADLSARRARLPSRARQLGIFQPSATRASAYGRCGDCRFADRCAICPAAIAHVPNNGQGTDMPDFACAFQRAALACQERFPVQPTPLDLLTGKVPAYGAEGEAQRRLSGQSLAALRAGGASGSGRAPR